MTAIFQKKKIMIPVMCVIILLMAALVTFCVLRKTTKKYTQNSSWYVSATKIEEPKKENSKTVYYDIHWEIELKGKDKALKADITKVIKVNDIEDYDKLERFYDNGISSEITLYFINAGNMFGQKKFVFIEYPNNSKENTLMIYYTDNKEV